ncbi:MULTISPECIES: aminoglycoside phosphotransferase family protein [Nitrincola]|uniref:Putative phosphotransferase related to Ser/Thr protein kinase n=1 Tax=Nitrincola nitratireducens TaxID=1229521 RepID=W9V9E7_9GAMM|nr:MULTISPECIES: phosphotransferase [Nitrincola]EXJ12697.1 putative phosphotransferase related to Ser/Thr protein kinase [Nitrincola nitratireducens]
MGDRQQRLNSWVIQTATELNLDIHPNMSLVPVSGDASFRRYYRLLGRQQNWIVMDAPPNLEDSRPFVEIAEKWHESGIKVPEILAKSLELGFLLLEDFGDTLLYSGLVDGKENELYAKAARTLASIQAMPGDNLPLYDAAKLQTEMGLFDEWFLSRWLGLDISDDVHATLAEVKAHLVASALAQPQVIVHRDYHSRNLMILPCGNIGVIDFQDAVKGAITYDLVSLFRDSYISWPDEQVYEWLETYRQVYLPDHLSMDAQAWRQCFDWMGMQRQLKVCGIFARLSLRDGKDGYLGDIPLTLSNLYRTARRYPEFSNFADELAKVVIPALSSHPRFQGQSLDHWWQTL